MNLALAILGSLIGLFVTGSAIFTIWYISQQGKSAARQDMEKVEHAEIARNLLLKWSLLDYTVLCMFCIGTLFLLVDVVAMIRDRSSYPLYHLSYLVFGVVFSFLGMLFMLVRLVAVLNLSRPSGSSAPDNHYKPNQADHSK